MEIQSSQKPKILKESVGLTGISKGVGAFKLKTLHERGVDISWNNTLHVDLH